MNLMPEDIGQEPQVKPGQEPASLPNGTASESADEAQAAESRTYDAEYVKRLRNEAAKYRTESNDLAARLKTLEDANKSDTERLAEKAALAERLLPELDEARKVIESLTKALQSEVDAQRKGLPEELMALLPDADAPAQLDWIRKAKAAADKLKPPAQQTTLLPASGGRSPGQQTGNKEFTEEEKRAHARIAAQRF